MKIITQKCRVEGCVFPTDRYRKGLCRRHYQSLRKYGDELFIQNRKYKNNCPCSVIDCSKQAFVKNLCRGHYLKNYKYGHTSGRINKSIEWHGLVNHELYNVWTHMIQRCENPNNTSYRYYGLIGVKVCKRWRSSFMNFYKDMGERPKGMTLDRINPYGDYKPNNVRWATAKEQANNQRKHKAPFRGSV